MQVLDSGHAARIEQVLALTAIAGAVALPRSDVGQGVLDLDAFAQRRTTDRRLLALTQFLQQALVAMDADTAPVRTRRAVVMQRAGLDVAVGKWTRPPGTKGISSPWGQVRMARSQSRWKAVLVKWSPGRTGQALH